jgi:hypothetical protein
VERIEVPLAGIEVQRYRLTMSSRLKRYQQEDHWHFTIGENRVWGGLVPKIRARQSTSAVVLGKFMSVEGIARVTLRQTGEQAAGLGLVLVAER